MNALQITSKKRGAMPAQWTAYIVGEMHLYSITGKELSRKIGYNAKYLSALLNGKREPKEAETKIRSALAEIIAERKNIQK